MLRFRVLGRLRVDDGDQPVAVPRGNLSVLLAGLLLHVNQVVADERLIEWLWTTDQPAHPRRALQVCVVRLRRILGTAVIESHPGGYSILGRPETVDLLRVRELLDRAKAAHGDDPALESELLAAALAHWEHPILPELRSDTLRRDAIDPVDEMWASVVQSRIDADLAVGRHAELLGELASLVSAFPLRERFRAQSMTALHRSGRRAEALAEFDSARRRLAAELGADPSTELRELHRRILAGDPTLEPPPARELSATVQLSPPAQLPTDLSSFVGRDAELDRLGGLVDVGGTSVQVGVIDGMAGVGKTALAVHVAHRLAGRFPDGQLFLDLHGFTDGVPAVSAADALDRMLRALGVPGSRIPPEPDDRAALFRSRLAASRTLVVLDNAATEAQVRPLLPAAPGCLVLVTSRRRLSGLDDGQSLSLDVLPPADAEALFTRAAGTDRVARDPAGDVAAIVELCGRLPLAIRIAAARLRSRPAWPAAHLAHRLREHRRRLEELDVGRRSVTAALDLSCRDLTDDERHLYELVGLHPGTEFTADAAAALAGTDPDRVARRLDELVDVNLLTEPAPGRFRFHDLTRSHAAAAAGRLPPTDRESALTRLLDHYADVSGRAMDLVYPYESELRPHRPQTATPTGAPATPALAEAWLDAEMDTLLAAAGCGRPRYVVHQAATLHRHLRTRADHARAEVLQQQALQAARDLGAPDAEVAALSHLGDVHRFRGRWDTADDHYRHALRLARRHGDRTGELLALAGLGWTASMRYQYGRATERYHAALAIARELGHPGGELDVLLGLGNTHSLSGDYGAAAERFAEAERAARAAGHRIGEQTALIGLGWVDTMRGRYEPATARYRRALGIALEVGDRGGEVQALTGLGHAHRAVGEFATAAGCHERVLALARAAGDRTGELAALAGLGQVHHAWGHLGPAADRYDEALELARAAGDDNWQFEAVHGLGNLALAAGRPAEALDRHRRALALAVGLEHRADQARAHNGLGHAHRALHEPTGAREHWARTLDIMAGLGTDRLFDETVTADAVRGHLADLDLDLGGAVAASPAGPPARTSPAREAGAKAE